MGIVSTVLRAVAAVGDAVKALSDWANARLRQSERTQDKQSGAMEQRLTDTAAQNKALRESNEVQTDAMSKTVDEALDDLKSRADNRSNTSNS